MKNVLPLLLMLVCSSCRDQWKETELVSEPPASSPIIIGVNGDTIPAEVPIPVKSTTIPLSDLPPPTVTRAIPPRPISVNNNVYARFQTETLPVDESKLQRHIILEAEEEQPPLVKKSQLPATFLPAKALGALRSEDIATHDIRYLDVTQGLSTSYLWAICMDESGYIWYSAAEEGVCRYDGNFTTCFSESEGLLSNNVYEIIEDRHHNLWFAGKDGVTKFDGTNFTNFELLDQQDAVLCLFEDQRGFIWWGTVDQGVMRYDPVHDEIRQFKSEGLFSSVTYHITEDQKGNLWFGGAYGAYAYDRKQFTVFNEKAGLVYPAVTCIAEDSGGRIWMTTPAGLSIYDGQSFQNQLFPTNEKKPYFHFVFEDSRGQIWLATKRQGLFRFDGQNYYRYGEPEGLRFGEVIEMMEDKRGQLWVTTFGGGINVLDVNTFRYFSTTDGLKHNYIDALAVDATGNLWIANEGLTRFDGEHYHHFSIENGLPETRVYSLASDEANNLWIGMNNVIAKYDGQQFIQYHFLTNPFIHQILPAQNGDLWISTNVGVIRINDEKYTYFGTEEGLPNSDISVLAEDAQGNIWMGAEAVLTKYDGRHMTHFTFHRALPGHYISDCYVDRNATVWLGTNKGLYQYQRDSLVPVLEAAPLSRENISGILEDERGGLWVSTEKGLMLIEQDAGSQSGYQTQTFYGNVDLKIPGFSSAIALDAANRLWLGSTKGLVMLPLDQFYAGQKAYVPPVFLTELKLNDTFINFSNASQSVAIDADFENQTLSFDTSPPFFHYPTGLKVPYGIDHFTFTYTGIDWKSPTHLQYQYQLQGLDAGWSQMTLENKVDYRNIPPGTYTFMVKAGSDAGIWSDPLNYRFTIRPPWWLTGWAYIGYTLLFGLLTYAFFLFLKARLQLENQLQYEQAEAQRLKELDTFKTRLYTNLTHEFRTPLTVILGMAEQMREQPRKNFRQGIQLIERNGRQLIRLINQLLDLSKLENKAFQLQLLQGDLVHYLRYLTESFQTYANANNLGLRFSAGTESLITQYDPEQIKQIMTNLISNAVKFTPSGGHIQVSLLKRGQEVVIQVQDNGVGIDKKDLPYIFDRFYQVDDSSTRKGEGTGIGLAHTRELVQLMEGKIQVESQKDQGTTFSIVLPIISPGATAPDKPVSIHASPFPVVEKGTAEPRENHTPSGLASELPELLIIEDNYDVVLYLQACLEDAYFINVAYNGESGIDMALKNVPDIIICDVMIPEKDGYKVCETLKNDDRTSHIPIILLTAKADIPSRIKGLRQGADAYLSKPFHKEELLVRLQLMVEKQQKLAAHYQRKWQESSPTATAAVPSDEQGNLENAFLEKLTDILETNYGNEQFGLPDLCKKLGMSRSQLFRKMKAVLQMAPSDFIRSFRLRKAKYLLENTDLNVNEVTWKVGFSNPTHFSRIFKEEFGVSPSSYGNK